MFQPTVPAGPPSSVEVVMEMINASIAALDIAKNTLLKECWVCFSPRPPFYEGITSFSPVIHTNSSESLSWHPSEGAGLTLSQVVGIGLCLLGSSMLSPQSLIPIYNQTLLVNRTFNYIWASNGSYLACSIGLTTYIITKAFLETRNCVVVQLLPKLTVHPAEDLLQFWDRGDQLP